MPYAKTLQVSRSAFVDFPENDELPSIVVGEFKPNQILEIVSNDSAFASLAIGEGYNVTHTRIDVSFNPKN